MLTSEAQTIWNATLKCDLRPVSFSVYDIKFLTKIYTMLIESVFRVLACFNQKLNVTLFCNIIIHFHVVISKTQLSACIKNPSSLKLTS